MQKRKVQVHIGVIIIMHYHAAYMQFPLVVKEKFIISTLQNEIRDAIAKFWVH